jgi:hypothetical protein
MPQNHRGGEIPDARMNIPDRQVAPLYRLHISRVRQL